MASRSRVTIRDVAREANVSIATVSRVLNGQQDVNAQMADRVLKAARSIGYRPNAAAQGLVSGAFRTIGVVVPDLGNPYFHDILKATVTSAMAEGYRTVVLDTLGSPDEELEACLQQLPNVDGLILISPRMSVENLKTLVDQEQPLVIINRQEPGIDVPTVVSDNQSPVRQLCQHLAELGHKHILYLAGHPSAWQNIQRWEAIRTSARELRLTTDLLQAEATFRGGYDAVDEAMSFDPTAIIAFNDLSAFGVITRLNEGHIEVPTDISVAGFDDIEISQHIDPPLTTAVSPKTELGTQGWQLMKATLDERPIPAQKPISAPLVIRSSTGAAPR